MKQRGCFRHDPNGSWTGCVALLDSMGGWDAVGTDDMRLLSDFARLWRLPAKEFVFGLLDWAGELVYEALRADR